MNKNRDFNKFRKTDEEELKMFTQIQEELKKVDVPVDEILNKWNEEKEDVNKMNNVSEEPLSVAFKEGVIIAPHANVRKNPTVHSDVLEILKRGTKVNIEESGRSTSEFYYIKLSNGEHGYLIKSVVLVKGG